MDRHIYLGESSPGLYRLALQEGLQEFIFTPRTHLMWVCRLSRKVALVDLRKDLGQFHDDPCNLAAYEWWTFHEEALRAMQDMLKLLNRLIDEMRGEVEGAQ